MKKRNMETLKDWCKDIPPKMHTLYLHYSNGTIIGKFPIKEAIDSYGYAKVTNSYYDGDGLISVWLI